MSKLLILFVGLIAISSVRALRCWTCQNARSDDECKQKGRWTKCPVITQVCYNEVRVGSKDYDMIITKSCKQPTACINDHIQNPRRAWSPSQCNMKTPSSVCRCCCNKDLCNGDALFCLRALSDPEPECMRIGVPEFGSRRCTPSVNNRGRTARLGTVCRFSCDNDHRLLGRSASVCVRSRNAFDPGLVFNNPMPRCVPKTCEPPAFPPLNGTVDCTDRNNPDSICTYSCERGFVLKGSRTSRCGQESIWSGEPPSCLPITCIPYPNPRNGDISCSKENLFGSICRFVCNEGYNLNGVSSVRCLARSRTDEVGRWTGRVPICVKVTCKPPHRSLGNGDVRCSDFNNVGSNCEFTCNDGYFLSGEPVSTCLDDKDGDNDGVWTSPPPTCIRITCTPPHTPPTNGRVTCSNQNFEGSECEFFCNNGYYLEGAPNSVCQDDFDNDADGVWSQPPPRCERVVCIPSHSNPTDGRVDCSDRNNAGSVCRFRCDKGYYLDGSPTSVCRDDGNNDREGVWSELAPVCIRIVCQPPHVDPRNGTVSCSDSNNEGSICSFNCNAGYYRDGFETSVCEHKVDGEGEWNRPAPLCKRVTCKPPQEQPRNGFFDCTDSNFVGSECEFLCGSGYFLSGSSKTSCQDDGDGDEDGVWTYPPPTCVQIICNPRLRSPGNGTVSCTNDNLLGSVCSFSCNSGFSLDRAISSTCQDDLNGDAEGVWSHQPPTCVRITCTPRQTDPTNGTVSCTDANNEGSVCKFFCARGYYIDGSSSTTCEDDLDGDADGVWSHPPPRCRRVTCVPPHSDPVNGVVHCVDSNYVESACLFVCRPGYDRVGAQTSVCEDDRNGDRFGVWSSPAPTCRIRTCQDPPGPPENGFVVCTRGNLEGSTCEYGCHGYRTRNGSLYTTCVSTGDSFEWDNPAPICQINRCPEQTLPRGEVTCDDTLLRATTTCSFNCTEPTYEIYPPELTQNTCLNDTTWNLPMPCCTRPCPPFAKMDLVIVLDSSSSITRSNWLLMTQFVREFIGDFRVGRDLTHFGVFRYNKVVDTNTQILLDDYPTNETALITAFNRIPYNGSGTRTGTALVHARDVLFTSTNGNRPNARDVLLVITDGKSQDDVAEAAKDLRNDGVFIIVLGIESPGRQALDFQELVDIAGTEENVVIASEGFAGLDERLAAQLGEQVCGDPCKFVED